MPDVPVLLHACERCWIVAAVPETVVIDAGYGHREPPGCGHCGGPLLAMREGLDLGAGWMYRAAEA